MKKVLIAEDDMILRQLLRYKLKESGERHSFELLFACDGEEAIDILAGNDIAVLVTDIQMPKIDGFSLLSHMSKHHPETPCIIITAYSVPAMYKTLVDNVFYFIKKPVMPEKLAEIIVKAMSRKTLNGNVSGVSLPSFMQMIEMEQKTCRLDIRTSNDERGTLYFYDGVLHDAEFETLTGEEAAIEMLAMDKLQISISGPPKKKRERWIESTPIKLSLEAMKRKDEGHRAEKEMWTARARLKKLMADGIELAEGMHFKEAYYVFNKFLSLKKDHALGWLWLSRCLGSLEKIRIVFNKAYGYDPKDPEIILEERKILSAEAVLSNDRVARCPFCWTPNDPHSLSCHYCNAFFVVSRETIPRMGRANPAQLQRAVKRYERVLLKGLDNRALFYGGLAHLNLKNLDAALDFFKNLNTNASPDNPYKKQVQRLLDFLARKQTEKTSVVKPDSTKGMTRDPSKKSVLVVEDSPTTRKVITMVLENNGFNVVEASDGLEALGKLNEERPNLVLLDVILPKMDGYEILSLIRKKEEFKGIPVVMLTSKDSLLNKLKGRFSGTDAYLTKPFKPEELIREISKHIN